VRPAAEEVVAQLRTGSATALTVADVASLPLSDETRDRARRKLAGDVDALRRATRGAAAEDALWSIEARDVIAVVVVAGRAVLLSSAAKLQGDRVCLGRVRAKPLEPSP
jgi:hypothetical protein